MSFLSDPDSNEENRPWWAGSRPRWRSPWSLDEEEEPVAAPLLREEADWTGEEIRSQYRRRVKRRSRGVKRVGTSWTSLVLMAMAVLSLTFLAWLYVTDAEEVEDKDLMIATPSDLTPTITAPGRLAVFLGSVTAVPNADLIGRPAWEWDTGSMVNWLVENSQALDNLKDLLEDLDWHGRHASWHFADLGNHQNWAAAMMLKQVEAAYLQRDGQMLVEIGHERAHCEAAFPDTQFTWVTTSAGDDMVFLLNQTQLN